jgi:hypothetical protein
MNPLELQVLTILSGHQEIAQRAAAPEFLDPSPVLTVAHDLPPAARKPRAPRRRAVAGRLARPQVG